MKKIRMNCTATLDETFADLRRGFSEELRQLFPAGANESNRRENQNVCQRPLTALHGARGWRAVFYLSDNENGAGSANLPLLLRFIRKQMVHP